MAWSRRLSSPLITIALHRNDPLRACKYRVRQNNRHRGAEPAVRPPCWGVACERADGHSKEGEDLYGELKRGLVKSTHEIVQGGRGTHKQGLQWEARGLPGRCDMLHVVTKPAVPHPVPDVHRCTNSGEDGGDEVET